jgi:hypothetical protein
MLNKTIGFLLLVTFVINSNTAQQVATSKFIGVTAFRQFTNDSLKPIDPSLFKEDFGIFRNALQQIHPSLYRFNDKKAINNLFDSWLFNIKSKYDTNQVFLNNQIFIKFS